MFQAMKAAALLACAVISGARGAATWTTPRSPVGRQQYMAWGCGAAGVYTCRHRGPCSLDGQLTRGGYTD